MLEPKTEKVTYVQKNPKPFYLIAGIWAIGTLFLKMYKLSSYIILGALSAGAYFLVRKLNLYPDVTIEKEVVTLKSFKSTLQQEFIEEGTKSLTGINEIAKRIDTRELRADVDELVSVSDKILDFVYENPDAASKLRKLVYYYLPTIEKRLNRYDQIEEETVDNTMASKAKIEGIVKTTVAAFNKQYNELFDSDTIDISSEVKVLEKVLVSEGLVDPENK
ncbi:MAG: 5-bromo-4-chloroindolyl phosphate hydrolysis family protein [Erysipelotrichaceae bacterium]|nr:5-bromo-4-chloroindolyl phosphate hydrolysis family protein [Erysipelotrichaceae bacterium]